MSGLVVEVVVVMEVRNVRKWYGLSAVDVTLHISQRSLAVSNQEK
jgi:hypothetical protein